MAIQEKARSTATPPGAQIPLQDDDPGETWEWLDALDYVLKKEGRLRAAYLVRRLWQHLARHGAPSGPLTTPYVNTIPREEEPPYPGDRQIERRIKSIIRWNAMAMVVKANRYYPGIGGHISTYASAATLLEVAFNHFLRAGNEKQSGDIVYFQGHAAPGIYARAFLEGRISETQLHNFRRELADGGGLSSYPHPWLMPDFWQFPTVSMGLSPLMAIYQARFNRYLEDRGLKETSQWKVWAFLGDGEMDEPESLAALPLAARERLDNLIFVVNCNLQRLDGPVRGNGKIIQELEALFRGAGWNVIKVIWGSEWDPLLEQDTEGLLVKRMEEAVDGDYQKYTVSSGDYIRRHFFGTHPRLLEMVAHLSDEDLRKLRRGGHDPQKVYAAYKAAVEHRGSPTVILAKTIKGYGLGEAGEGRNISHQQKKLNEEELRAFRKRFDIPIPEEQIPYAPFYRPPEDSPEMRYLRERRQALGGYLPRRVVRCRPMKAPDRMAFQEFYQDSRGRAVSTTMGFTRILRHLMEMRDLGRHVVPIVPDEARTFGMEALFRQFGIYSHVGQLYEPVDKDSLLSYREAQDGQILEEGINEAGAMASFIAAGTAYATHGVPTVPFFIFYSMFGFQRVGDLIWAAADARARGFLLGATSGRTTLSGEGLQHQDGHSHLLASTVPTLAAYDPAFVYEVAVILQDGLRRMLERLEPRMVYITLGNEPYPMPAMPEGVEEGILRGLYRFQPGPEGLSAKAHIFASGALIREALRAQTLLAQNYQVSADIWSATSYKALREDCLEVERWNRLHPRDPRRKSYLEQVLEQEEGPIVAVSDFMRAVPDQIAPWIQREWTSLGTDGFGRSDSREALRRWFEVDAAHIVVAVLERLAQRREVSWDRVEQALRELRIDPEKSFPLRA